MVFSLVAVERVRNLVPEARSLNTIGAYSGWMSFFIFLPLLNSLRRLVWVGPSAGARIRLLDTLRTVGTGHEATVHSNCWEGTKRFDTDLIHCGHDHERTHLHPVHAPAGRIGPRTPGRIDCGGSADDHR